MALRSLHARRFGAIVLSAGLITGLGACSPIQTHIPYDPSDGVQVELSNSVKATNLLVLTRAEGEAGTLVGSLTNLTESAAEVTVQVGAADPIEVSLEAGVTAYLTPKLTEYEAGMIFVEARVSAVDSAPGSTIPVTITTPADGTTNIQVPVLDGTLEPYADYLP